MIRRMTILFLVVKTYKLRNPLSLLPCKEFELVANSLGARIETHCGLILRTLSKLTVNSQDDSQCELAVSYL